jgi:recombination protein RecR
LQSKELFHLQTYPTRLLEEAVNELSKLPGIGRKTALRMALHLLKRPAIEVELLGNSIIRMRNDIHYCSRCHNISDETLCEICSNQKRDQSTICVVEDVRDVIAIENTGQFSGVYHILGGIISPIEGIGPNDLHVESLVARAVSGGVKEIILALPTTIEGDTTNFYLFRRLNEHPISLTIIARGISIGDELEHTDEVTLGRSIINRTPYETAMSRKS